MTYESFQGVNNTEFRRNKEYWSKNERKTSSSTLKKVITFSYLHVLFNQTKIKTCHELAHLERIEGVLSVSTKVETKKVKYKDKTKNHQSYHIRLK